MKNYKGFGLPVVMALITILLVSATALFVYENTKQTKLDFVKNDEVVTTMQYDQKSIVQDENNIDSSVSTASDITIPAVLQYKEYIIKYVPAEKTLNTLRFRFYGPATVEGYDSKGNITNSSALLTSCAGKSCSTNSKLRLVFYSQINTDGSQKPIVTIALDSVEKEYKDWLSGDKKNGFLSSVVTVKLPDTPPTSQTMNYNGWDSYIASIYYDNDDDGKLDPIKDYFITSTDSLAFSTGRSDVPQGFIDGWNFMRTTDKPSDTKEDPDKKIKYRKSFENQISLIPIFSIKSQINISAEKPIPVTSKSIIDDTNEKIKKEAFTILNGASIMKSGDDNTYEHTCKDGVIDTNSKFGGVYTTIPVNNIIKYLYGGDTVTKTQESAGIKCYASKEALVFSVKLVPGGSDGDNSYCTSINDSSTKLIRTLGIANPSNYTCTK